MKIFVSIASYMDHQLEETIDSCLENAHFKDRIHIAVCDQSEKFNQTVHDKVKYYTFIDYRSARGPCWARHLLQTVMQDEEYYLQVDSHTLFHEDWDVHLAHHIDKLGKNAIISTYPLDHKSILKRIKKLKLKITMCHSKSGGAHLFLFFEKPIEAKEVRNKLTEMSAALGYGSSEIFPKQVKLNAERGDTGSFLNLPYFDAENTMRYAFKENGEAATLEEFFELYEKKVCIHASKF
mgnify:CR=1 FL=1